MNAQTQQVATLDEARPARRASLIEKMAANYQMEPTKFAESIKATCIKGRVSNEQFAAFLMVADKYGLNPLLKEVYAFPQDGGIVPIVGVDGWSRIINNHPQFDGMEFEDTRSEKGEIEAITCRMFRKDRQHPIEATEYLAECRRGTQPWKQWPARMLRHKAMIQAARYAFGFTGIIEQDEWERQRESKRLEEAPARGRFASLRQPEHRPTYGDGDVIDAEPDHSPDAGNMAADETAEGPEGESPDDKPEAQGGGSEASPSRPQADSPSAPDDEPNPSAQRFYAETLAAISKAQDAAAAQAVLDQAGNTPLWFEITDDQVAGLKRAVAAREG